MTNQQSFIERFSSAFGISFVNFRITIDMDKHSSLKEVTFDEGTNTLTLNKDGEKIRYGIITRLKGNKETSACL